MANLSLETDHISDVIFKTIQNPEIPEPSRFDPTKVTYLGGTDLLEDLTEIFLKRTLSLFVSGGMDRDNKPTKAVGHKTVAVFAEEGPGLSRQTTEDIIHRNVDWGVWLRKPTEPELEADGGVNTCHVWIFETVVPRPDRVGSGDIVVPTGVTSKPYVLSAR